MNNCCIVLYCYSYFIKKMMQSHAFYCFMSRISVHLLIIYIFIYLYTYIYISYKIFSLTNYSKSSICNMRNCKIILIIQIKTFISFIVIINYIIFIFIIFQKSNSAYNFQLNYSVISPELLLIISLKLLWLKNVK